MSLGQTESKFVTELSTDSFIDVYKKALVEKVDLGEVGKVRIIGSFGRNDANQESDMDVWIITNKRTSLATISRISDEEIAVREDLKEKFGYPNLTRHRATIFSREEADLYESTFSVRVGSIRTTGESTTIWGGTEAPVVIPTLVDLVASIEEFDALYDIAEKGLNGISSRKYARRVCKEMKYITEGVRLNSNAEVDAEISINYNNSPAEVMEESRQVRDQLYLSGLDPVEVARRKIAYICMFTMEKVRWELTYGLADPQILENWRKGISRLYAFYPKKIKEFVCQTAEQLGIDPTEELEQIEKISTEPVSPDLLEEFNRVNTDWMLLATRKALNGS